MSKTRNVIVHYHLFKNAGSSIDQLLKNNFKDQWFGYDSDSANGIIPCVDIENMIRKNQDKIAFSSHQIIPPLPEIEGVVYPVVILRDPIDRIKSAYLFERKKQLGLEEPKGTLEDYIREKFRSRRNNPIEEFQTIRLSNGFRDRFQDHAKLDDEALFENASRFIKSLKFVGIVDDFDRTVALLSEFLKPAFPDFRGREVKANVLQDLSMSQQEKRDQIRSELSAEIFEEIIARNSLDEALYQVGKSHFEELFSQSGLANTKAA